MKLILTFITNSFHVMLNSSWVRCLELSMKHKLLTRILAHWQAVGFYVLKSVWTYCRITKMRVNWGA